jgi:RNA-dependent RNA polymerase
MELNIKYINFEASQWDVTKAIAAVLHTEFPKLTQGNRPLNFKVKLNKSKAGGVGNDGSGKLFLPSHKAGQAFLDWFRNGGSIKIRGSKLKFFCCSGKPSISRGLKMELEKAPYIDPDIDEKRESVLYTLERQLRVDEVQFGVFYHPRTTGPPQHRIFSSEWYQSYESTAAWLKFEYDHKLIRVQVSQIENICFPAALTSFVPLQLGNDMTETVGSRIAIPFTSIHKLGMGREFGKPCRNKFSFLL